MAGELASLDILGFGEGSTVRPSILFPSYLKDRNGDRVGQLAALRTPAAGKGFDLNIKVLRVAEYCNSGS